MTLLGAAAVPVVFMAALLAWHAYTLAGHEARARAILLRETAAARHDAALDGVGQIVAALSRSVVVWGGDTTRCSTLLEVITSLSPDRYANLLAVDRNGIFRCGAFAADSSVSFGAQAWFQQMRNLPRPIGGKLLPIGGSGSQTPDRLTVAYPILKNGQFAGALVAVLRLGWFTQGTVLRPTSGNGRAESWLIDEADRVRPIEGARVGDVPSAATAARLVQAGEGALIGPSVGGDLFAYAGLRLPDGLSLLSGFRVQELVGAARATLIARLAVLGLLLALGLAAVGVGADRTVVGPINRLTQAVRRWRAGEVFDGGGLHRAPAEIAELGQAFSQTTAKLAEREAQLRGALKHQELLMQEVHHRVKNNLQIVASLLNLQAKRIRQPGARAEFQSARDRVRALATLHRHLYAEGELHAIHMRPFLVELCAQLFQAMGETEGDRIALLIDAPELEMSSDQAVPLSLLVTEAVSNAIKYAFPNGRRGHLTVRLAVVPDAASADLTIADLTIADDGVGIAEGLIATRPNAEMSDPRDGLGLQLMRGFARQLGSELRVEQDHGTKYNLAIRLRRDRPDLVRETPELA